MQVPSILQGSTFVQLAVPSQGKRTIVCAYRPAKELSAEIHMSTPKKLKMNAA